MISAEDLIKSLDDGSFDSAIDKILASLDKDGLNSIMQDMEAKAASIPDQDKRHLYKNGIGAIKMTIDGM